MYRIGIDLGGTNTAAGLVDDQGKILDRASVKTNLPTDPQRIVRDMVYLTNLLLERNGLRKENIVLGNTEIFFIKIRLYTRILRCKACKNLP